MIGDIIESIMVTIGVTIIVAVGIISVAAAAAFMIGAVKIMF